MTGLSFDARAHWQETSALACGENTFVYVCVSVCTFLCVFACVFEAGLEEGEGVVHWKLLIYIYFWPFGWKSSCVQLRKCVFLLVFSRVCTCYFAWVCVCVCAGLPPYVKSGDERMRKSGESERMSRQRMMAWGGRERPEGRANAAAASVWLKHAFFYLIIWWNINTVSCN